jgi:hypothetical protein
MQRRTFITLAAAPLLAQDSTRPATEIPIDLLHDKIRGGFLGQLLGDLNGLAHEMKYIAEPGDVQEYILWRASLPVCGLPASPNR